MDLQLKKRIVQASSIILGSLAIFVGLFWWLATDIRAQTQGIAELRTGIYQNQKVKELLPTLQKNAQTAEKYTKALQNFFPHQSELLLVSSWFGQQARIAQIDFDFAFSQNQTDPTTTKPGTIGFTIKATGSLENISQFLKTIEYQAPRFAFMLQNINIGQQTENTYRLTTQGTLFFIANTPTATP